MNLNYEGINLDLKNNFSMSIEETSPIFNDYGTQSISAQLPPTLRNLKAFRWPGRLDTVADPNNRRRPVTVEDGVLQKRGVINVTEVSLLVGITFSIGFDESTAYSAWMDKKLKELADLPEVFNTHDGWIREFDELYRYGDISDPFAVFPVALSREEEGSDEKLKKTYWEMVNVPNSTGSMRPPGKVNRIIDGTKTEVTVPAGYGLTPFLRVWRVLELIFADLGVEIKENPFKGSDLARLVVLNNVADAVCRGWVSYAELLPDCTVQDFMHALWVRFGLTYHVDSEERTVRLRLLDDILQESPQLEIDPYTSSPERNIIYEGAKYIKLSASTGIDGAAPACERYEDYIAGLSLDNLHVGSNIADWHPASSGSGWEGEIYDGEEWEPDYPDDRDPGDYRDPWDDYYYEDDRDHDRAYTRGETRASEPTRQALNADFKTWIGRETVTGRWWKLDMENGKTRDSSSSFFSWDPATPGIDPEELSSDDECVPIEKVSTGATGTTHPFSDYVPAYLVGARHFHSYIRGNDSTNEGSSGDTTPLAFVWAYNLDRKTVGRIAPEQMDGTEIEMEDGGDRGTTLYFQFGDGLFARYWRRYDEMLRHGMRTVELDVRLSKKEMKKIDILRPVVYKGCLCLIDKMEYTLPAKDKVAIRVSLKTISTLGNYDIDKEQGIPAVEMVGVGNAWVLRECDWQAVEDALQPDLDREAWLKFKSALKHLEWHGEGEELVVDPQGVYAVGDWIETIPTTKPADTPPAPIGASKLFRFKGHVYYDCRMVRRTFDDVTGVTVTKETEGEVVGRTFVEFTFDAKYVSGYVVKR